jgi:nitronate monooxygenase
MELLGLRVPVVQAPIGSPCSVALVAAASGAGALGMLAGSWDPVPVLRAKIDQVRGHTTEPFGVNLVLQWPQHHRLVACLDAGIRVISTFWGDPAAVNKRIHSAGAIHLHTVGTVDEARRAAEAGVDVIVAQGWEAGGHVRGDVGSLALVPAVVDAVSPVPVIAAGGIADGRGLAAALVLGAQAGWVGSAFLLAQEAATEPGYQSRLLDANADDTTHGMIFDGGWPDAPHRVLRNSTVQTWEAAGRPSRGSRPAEDEVVGHTPGGNPIHRYDDLAPYRGVQGETEAMALYAGQGVGLLRKMQPAVSIIDDLVTGAAAALSRCAGRPVLRGGPNTPR